MKTQTKNTLLVISLMAFILAMPLISAYEVRSALPGLNLWDALVDYTFGSFWMTALILTILLWLILIWGGISPLTGGMFVGVFLFAMVLGYGYEIVSVPLFVASLSFLVWQFYKLMSEW